MGQIYNNETIWAFNCIPTLSSKLEPTRESKIAQFREENRAIF